MRFNLGILAAAVFAVMAQAVGTTKSVLVSYPDGTDQSIVDAAKSAIVQNGGKITHEYTIFQGFAATVPDDILTTSALTQGNPTIEDDGTVSIQKGETYGTGPV